MSCMCPLFFFFNDTATTEIYTLSLHDALPIFRIVVERISIGRRYARRGWGGNELGVDHHAGGDGVEVRARDDVARKRSEEHTSELQSQSNLVCRLLLEKKKKKHRASKLSTRHH